MTQPGAGTVERYVLVQCGAPAPTLAGRSRRGAGGDSADLVAVLGVTDASVDARRPGTPRCSDRRLADEAADRRRDSRASEERPGSRIRAALGRSTRSSSSPSSPGLFMTGGDGQRAAGGNSQRRHSRREEQRMVGADRARAGRVAEVRGALSERRTACAATLRRREDAVQRTSAHERRPFRTMRNPW